MKYFDALYRSFYVLTSKTDLAGEPSIFSAWMLMSGVQIVNVITFNYLVLYFCASPVFSGRVSYIAIGLSIFALNAVYVFLRGEEACENTDSKSFMLAAWYAGLSFFAMMIVMALLVFQAAGP